MHKTFDSAKAGSEKSFGWVFTVVFLLFALYPLVQGGEINGLFLVSAGGVALFTIVRPAIYYWPNRLWFRLGLLLGAVVSPVVMAIVFFVVIFPLGMLMRALGKDPMHRATDPEVDTYWIERDSPLQPMYRQF